MAPTIETPRLSLRPWRLDDREAWVAMCADERVMRWLGGVRSRDQALDDANYLAAKLEANGFGWWIVEVKGGLPFAGLVALQDVPFSAPFTPAFEVGWRFVFDAWGHGYATEGGRAVLDFAFDILGKTEVVAITALVNEASQRVMTRIGMTRDPDGDFDNPRLPPEHRLNRHCLYRIARPAR